MSVLRYDNVAGLIQRRDALEKEFGYRVDVMPTDAVRDVLRSKKYYQALYDPACFHFHPLRYARALAVAVESLGGRIFEGTRADQVDLDGRSEKGDDLQGAVVARDLVLACGGYTDNLVPRIRRSILPIATYVLLTEPAGSRSPRPSKRPQRSAITAVPAITTG